MNQASRFGSGGEDDFPVEAAIPDGITSLDSILCTEELRRRSSRPPDYEMENRALVALASGLTDSPSNILQRLAETILDVTQCDSSGLSLLTKDDGGRRFYWPAIAGMWRPHIGGGTPRDFGPCGDVLDQNRTLLFRHFERRYPYLLPVIPAAEECLSVPFYVRGKAVGTIWAIMHSDRRKFDAEDERLMTALGQFASVAYQTVESLDDLKLQIAAREKAEAAAREFAVREGDARLRLILDTALDSVITIDERGVITAWNAQAERMFGWGSDEAAGRRIAEILIPPRYRTAHENGLRQFLATGRGPLLNRRVEITAVRRDGSEFPVELSIAPHRSGKTWFFSGFVRDITERKRSEEALRASELRWRTMFEKFPVGIVLRDTEQRYMAANPAFQQMVGYSEEELRQLSPLDITHEDDRPATERMLVELQASVRQSVEMEKRFRRKDDQVVWAMVSTFCIPEAGVSPAFYPAIIVDITERKRAEEALRESELELARISRLTTMGELAASIAHELRQPLSAAVTSGTTCQHWLAEQTLDLARARRAAQRMMAAAQRASEVMDRIRALMNKMPPQRGALGVNDLLRETLAVIDNELRSRQIVVATDLAEPCPTIIGDRVQLQQVVLNLIMNGVEAMSLVADRPRVLRIRSRRDGPDNVIVGVEDSGTGLDPVIAERIFDPFFTTKAGGMGMGLSICRSIIDGHGGRLWASPAPSHGALLQFTLPTEDGAP
jgi:PAS domain S-box-containing protein